MIDGATLAAFERARARVRSVTVAEREAQHHVAPQIEVDDQMLMFTGMDVDARQVHAALESLLVQYASAARGASDTDRAELWMAMVTSACLFGWELAQEPTG